MRALALGIAAFTLGFSLTAHARDDIMPPPAKAPRIPVERVPLAEKEAPASSREIEGEAAVVDGEKIMVDGKQVRLFGIVTPSLSSNFGPQARQQLEKMVKGAILCKITDRDRDGNPIAFCGSADVPDISYEMLRQGWAMADRRALKDNSLADIYQKAEGDAQATNRGMFAPTSMTTIVPLADPQKTVVVAAPPVAAPTPAPESQPAPAAAPEKTVSAQPAAESAPSIMAQIERYQTLIAAGILLLAAYLYGSVAQRREYVKIRETRRAVAAALRGELLSARQVFRAKARDLVFLKAEESKAKANDKPAARAAQLWPRIRTTIYQANTASLGLLGSELARRVASVYGQCTDYASYFQQAPAARLPSAKTVADTLTVLGQHMDVVLEGLAQVERTGRPFVDAPVKVTPAPVVVEESADDSGEDAEAGEPAAPKRSLADIARSIFAAQKAVQDVGDEVAEEESASESSETSSDQKAA